MVCKNCLLKTIAPKQTSRYPEDIAETIFLKLNAHAHTHTHTHTHSHTHTHTRTHTHIHTHTHTDYAPVVIN